MKNCLTAAYLAWLLIVLIVFGYTPTNDGEGYLELAQACLTEGSPYPTLSLLHNDSLPFIWNIGMVNLTALTLWLFHSVTPLLVLFCLLKALTAYLLAKTTEELFSCSPVIVLLLYMLYPNNWGQSTMLSSEIPADFLALFSIYLTVRSLRPTASLSSSAPLRPSGFPRSAIHGGRTVFLSGLLLALSNWFRPTAPIFLFALTLWLILLLRRRAWRPLFLLYGGYLCFIILIGTSTCLRTGHFVYQARSLWFSMVDECYDGAPTAPHWQQPVWPEGYPRYIENHEQLDVFECEEIWKQRSLEWLSNHKLEYVKKIPGRMVYMYQSDYDYLPAFLSDKSHPEDNYITLPFRHLLSEAATLTAVQWLALFTMLCYALLLVSAVGGTVSLFRSNRRAALLLPLLIVIGGTLMLTIVMHGETRFKAPFMPWLFMLAAVAYLKVNRS
jgi:hypothetical protein